MLDIVTFRCILLPSVRYCYLPLDIVLLAMGYCIDCRSRTYNLNAEKGDIVYILKKQYPRLECSTETIVYTSKDVETRKKFRNNRKTSQHFFFCELGISHVFQQINFKTFYRDNVLSFGEGEFHDLYSRMS